MPIYEYVCQRCGVRFEKFVRSMSSTAVVECPECKSQEVGRTFSVFGVGRSDHTSSLSSAAAPATSCCAAGSA